MHSRLIRNQLIRHYCRVSGSETAVHQDWCFTCHTCMLDAYKILDNWCSSMHHSHISKIKRPSLIIIVFSYAVNAQGIGVYPLM